MNTILVYLPIASKQARDWRLCQTPLYRLSLTTNPSLPKSCPELASNSGTNFPAQKLKHTRPRRRTTNIATDANDNEKYWG